MVEFFPRHELKLKYSRVIMQATELIQLEVALIFGSDRSPRRGNVVCVCVVRVIILRMTLKEFLMHSKESRRVLSKHACMHASKQASK